MAAGRTRSLSMPGLDAGSISHLSSAQCRSCHVSCGARESTEGTWKEFIACRAKSSLCINLPPIFPFLMGIACCMANAAQKKNHLNLLWTVWEQEKGSEVLALLLEPGRPQGRVETSPPQRLQPQQPLGRVSRAGDGACARMTRVKRDLI